MADTGTKIVSGNLLVTTAGTRERLTTTGQEIAAKSVIVQALSTNVGVAVVGGIDVVAEQGAHNAAIKRKGITLVAGASVSIDIGDPAQIFVDTTESKEGVTWIALLA